MRENFYWSTELEIKFLKHILSGFSWKGSQETPMRLGPTRISLILNGYAESIPKRTDWGNINRADIVAWFVGNGLPIDLAKVNRGQILLDKADEKEYTFSNQIT